MDYDYQEATEARHTASRRWPVAVGVMAGFVGGALSANLLQLDAKQGVQLVATLPTFQAPSVTLPTPMWSPTPSPETLWAAGQQQCHAGVITPEDAHVSVEVETCDQSYASTVDGATLSFKVSDAWTSATALPSTIERAQTVTADVMLTGWPTELKVEAGGDDGWCYRRISLVHCNQQFDIVPYVKTAPADGPDHLKYWVDANQGVGKSKIFAVPETVCVLPGQQRRCHAGVITPEDAHVSVEIETCDQSYASTSDGATLSFKVSNAWTSATALPSTIERAQTVTADVMLTGWPTELKVEAGGDDGWCYRRISLVHCNQQFDIVPYVKTAPADGPDHLKYWVDANQGVGKSKMFTVPETVCLPRP